jgi:hypothetical protein
VVPFQRVYTLSIVEWNDPASARRPFAENRYTPVVVTLHAVAFSLTRKCHKYATSMMTLARVLDPVGEVIWFELNRVASLNGNLAQPT